MSRRKVVAVEQVVRHSESAPALPLRADLLAIPTPSTCSLLTDATWNNHQPVLALRQLSFPCKSSPPPPHTPLLITQFWSFLPTLLSSTHHAVPRLA